VGEFVDPGEDEERFVKLCLYPVEFHFESPAFKLVCMVH
jgi:hypothetical protein